ncbi:MAG: AI-2E family transporter [Thermoguttaceae bacterium]
MERQPSAERLARGDSRVKRWVSSAVLAALTLVLAVLFYQLVRPLGVPLFFAAVVAMLVQPVYRRLVGWRYGSPWASATLVTLSSVVVLVGPLAAITYLGFAKLHVAVASLDAKAADASAVSPTSRERFDGLLATVSENLGTDPEQLRSILAGSGSELEQTLFTRTLQILGSLPRVLLSIVLFAVSVFFLLKDGEKLTQAWDDLTPLGPAQDQAIRREFVTIFRSVVWGTVAAALVQAATFAVGFLIINAVFGLEAAAWTFILTVLTLLCASIPFLGAVSVWAPTAVVLFLMGDRAAAVSLAIYGALVVSQVDTVIRVWILKDAAKLHPLLALVCVFGGILYFGILGVFLGPMIGALLMALLRILKRELDVA